MGWAPRTASLLWILLLPWAAGAADLAEIRSRGSLRILVPGDEDDPPISRNGSPASRYRDYLEDFAHRQGLQIQTVWVERRHDILDDLAAGRGDVAANPLTVTPERSAKVAFTDPVDVVDEMVMGHRGMKKPPRSAPELAGHTIGVPAGSVFEDSLAALKLPDLKVAVALPPAQQADLLDDVSRGDRELTVVDSNLLPSEEQFAPDAVRLFALTRKRPIAWALHPQAKELKTALDLFIQEQSLIAHAGRKRTGDLPEVKKHRVLRVLTRNNAVSYFLYRGEPAGFDYELMKRFADQLEVRLQIVVPPSHADLVPWLLDGRGDVIAASYTQTPERSALVAFSTPYLEVQELIVQRASEPRLTSVTQLAGRHIRVRPGSSYRNTLEKLRSQGVAFVLELARSDEETEDLIAQVAAGAVDLTVADSHIFQAEQAWRSDAVAAFPVGEKQSLGFAVRPRDKQLRSALDRYVARTYKSLEYNLWWRRYFENPRLTTEVRTPDAGVGQGLSLYDPIFRKYAESYGFDWRLLAAQSYQESRFDPSARSLAGAVGLFQVLPRTAKEMGFTRLSDPDEGAHAGIQHLARLADRLETSLPVQQRMRFALAAYNAGWGHLSDARQLARTRGLDPDKWFKSVEQAMLLLSQPANYSRARHGYVRGFEPVRYVSEIQTRYENYLKLVP
jgi:membrane-bound lytic murein transglycosylase F